MILQPLSGGNTSQSKKSTSSGALKPLSSLPPTPQKLSSTGYSYSPTAYKAALDRPLASKQPTTVKVEDKNWLNDIFSNVKKSAEFANPAIDYAKAGAKATAGIVTSKLADFYQSESPINKTLQIAMPGGLALEMDKKKEAQASKELKFVSQKAKESALKSQATGEEKVKKIGAREGFWGLADQVVLSTPSLVTSLGIGTAATIVTKNPVLGLSLGFSSSFTQEAGAAYLDAKKFGADEQTAENVGIGVGTINGLLESLPVLKILNRVSKASGGGLTTDMIKQKILKNVTQQILLESGTEGIQQIVSNAVALTYDQNRDLFAGVPESMMVGGILGGMTSISADTGIAILSGNSGNQKGIEEINKKIEKALETPKDKRTDEQNQILATLYQKELTPDQAITMVANSKINKTEVGRTIVKESLRAKETGDNIAISSIDGENIEVKSVDPQESIKNIEDYVNQKPEKFREIKSEDPLSQEATKYKSAEEFVKAQANLYHGTKSDFSEFDPNLLGTNTGAPSAKKGFFFTDNEQLANHYANPGRNQGTAISKNLEDAMNRVVERAKKEGLENSLSNNNGGAMVVGSWPKTAKATEVKSSILSKMETLKTRFDSPEDIKKINRFQQLIAEELDNTKLTDLELSGKVLKSKVNLKNPMVFDDNGLRNGASYAKRIDEAIAKGHDGVIIKNTQDPFRGDIYVAFDKSQIFTDTQLTDIWNKANKKENSVEKYIDGKTEKFRDDNSILRDGQPPIGQRFDSELVARDRFNIPILKKLSFGGSDRDVFDLENGTVLKVAKTARGLAQNMSEGEPYAPVPKSFESGKNYVVVEKIKPPDAITKKLIKDLNEAKNFNSRTPAVDMINDVANKYFESGDSFLEEIASSIQDLNNYTVMINDITAIRNWGTNSEGMPTLLDAGSLNDSILEEYKGVKSLDDPEFREVYNKSREAKRKFEDTDSYTKYRLKDDFKESTGVEITDDQEQQILDLNKKFFGDADVKITAQIIANNQALGSYREGVIKIIKGQADAKDTYLHEAVHKYLDVFTSKMEQIEILKEAQAKYGIDDFAQIEEKLAEDFIKYAKTREGVTGKIKVYFDKILSRINEYLGNQDKIQKLYEDIFEGTATKKQTKPRPEEQDPEILSLLTGSQAQEANATKPIDKRTQAELKDRLEELEIRRSKVDSDRAILSNFDSDMLKGVRRIQRKLAIIEKRGGDPTEVTNDKAYKTYIEDLMAFLNTNSEDKAIDYLLNDFPEPIRRVSTKEDLEEIRYLKSKLNPKEVEVPRDQIPVGKGKEKVSRLEARVKNVLKNAPEETKEGLGLSTYNQMNRADQIKKATEYVAKHPDDALKILKGDLEPPQGILKNSIYVALENYAVLGKDMNLARKLASLESTRLGQEISILSEMNPESPVKIIRDVIKIREDSLKKLSGKKKSEYTRKAVNNIKSNIKKTTKNDWNTFIESIKC